MQKYIRTSSRKLISGKKYFATNGYQIASINCKSSGYNLNPSQWGISDSETGGGGKGGRKGAKESKCQMASI